MKGQRGLRLNHKQVANLAWNVSLSIHAWFHAHTHPENMVPDRGAPEVYVEICVAVLDSH